MALLLAIFAILVVGTTTVAYVGSRDTSVLVARNAQQAADARALAAAGMDLTKELLHSSTSNWRTLHTNGRLLNNYSLDGGAVTIDLVDIVRRDAGVANPWPTATTTQLEVTVSSVRSGVTWQSVAHMSVPSVVNGQYAIYANKVLGIYGTSNFVGRWDHAPMSSQHLRVNLGTSATTSAWNGSSPWLSNGVWLQGGLQVESVVAGSNPADADSMKSTWVYYPNAATSFLVQGAGANLVAAKRMSASQSISMMTPPASPTYSGTNNWTNAVVLNGATTSYSGFRIKAALLPALFTRNFEARNNSVVTLNAGTYEVWGSWVFRDSRIIINGDVKIVANPNLALTGLDWQNSSVELNANSTLEIYNGYSMDVRNCWVGPRYICASEPNAALRDGDPHKRWWLTNTFTFTACDPTLPTSPRYIEPWRIRFYPMPQFLSSWFMWDMTDSCIVGSLFLPTNPIRFFGRTKVYGRVAANHVLVTDTSSFYYDHALDEITGLTEGTPPSRGGDPGQMFPVRVLRYGFDADAAR